MREGGSSPAAMGVSVSGDNTLLAAARKERKEKMNRANDFYREGAALAKAASTKEEHLLAAEHLTVAISL